jgi:DNA-directed RNA polymerase subunit alpha
MFEKEMPARWFHSRKSGECGRSGQANPGRPTDHRGSPSLVGFVVCGLYSPIAGIGRRSPTGNDIHIHPHGRDPMPRIAYKDLTQSDEMAEKLEMSTAEIGLSVRTTNCLEERGIFTVHDLLNCTRADLLSISNFGEKTLEEVYKSLEKIGFFRAARPQGTAVAKHSEPIAHAS